MTEKEMTAVVRRLFDEVWNQRATDVAEEIVADQYSSVENIIFAASPGPEKVAAEVEFYGSIYADLRFEIQRMLVDGDTVVTTWTATGTALNETFTDRGGNTRNKSLQTEGVSITTVKDGHITSHSFFWPRYPLFP